MLGPLSPILVVDGNATSRQETHKFLHGLGHKLVDYAPDGLTALRMIEQKNYKLIFSDGDMQGPEGFDLRQQTRMDQRQRYLPFLMAIALWKKKFIEIVREDGATLYLTKPFTPEILGQRMTQVSTDASRLKDTQTRMAFASKAATKNIGEIPALWRTLRPQS